MTVTEIRCKKRHALLDTEARTIEVKCNSRLCGAGPGIVVLHTYSTLTGEMVDTRRYRDPVPPQQEGG